MFVFIVAGAILLLVLWRGWGKPVLTRGQWRAGAGLLSLATFVGAAFVSLRGSWEVGLGLAAIGAVSLFGARSQRGPFRPPPPKGSQALSSAEARALLGVREQATADEIREAYARLMRLLHPDKGGTSGLAAQLNAARDRLLKG